MPVRCGSGHGARTLRSDTQRAAFVDPRDRAPARSDGMHVHGRSANRDAADREIGALADLTAAEAHVGRCASHIECDHRWVSRRPADAKRPCDPACGTRQHSAHRLLRRLFRADAAAVGLHDPQPAPAALRPQPLRQTTEVAPHHGRDVRVGDGRAGPLVLTVLRQEFVGHGDHHPAPARFRGDTSFVGRIEEGEQEANGERLTPAPLDAIEHCGNVCLIQRHDHAAVARDPLAHFEAACIRDERWRLRGLERIDVRSFLPPDDQRVAEALGRHERGARAPARQEGVGRDSGPMDDLLGLPAHLANARQYSLFRVARGAGTFLGTELVAIPKQEIRERTAHVDPKQLPPLSRRHHS